MIFRQYYLGCLSHASYLVGDEASGRAVVVDPQRDVSVYLADAESEGLRIEKVIETHFHADFLSGHLELAAATGASICYGPGAEAEFPIEHLGDGTTIGLGDVRLEVLATPGHTPESISLVVYEHAGDAVPYGVLTGDTLFIGDVGRPDLLSAAGADPDESAHELFASLHGKVLALPDETRVFPAHGAGSACGKHLSEETSSTIGAERRTNYALALAEGPFVAAVTEGQPSAPAYFGYDAHRNRETRPLLDEGARLARLDVRRALAMQENGAVILDTRDPADHAAGHLAGSVNVPLSGRFAEYAGDVLSPKEPVLLFCEQGHELEARNRLARIGFDNVAGCLDEPLRALLDAPEAVLRSSRLTAATLAALLADEGVAPAARPQLVDVRNAGELADGMIADALHIPLPSLRERLGEVRPERPVVVYCASGNRSSIAASVIARAGHGDVSDLLGGYDAWQTLLARGAAERAR